jgi:DNA topoisomerase-1
MFAEQGRRVAAVRRLPEELKSFLKPEQFKLYDLIWKRTIACQMIHATLDTIAVDLACGDNNSFRATGSSVRDSGFMLVYREGMSHAEAAEILDTSVSAVETLLARGKTALRRALKDDGE